MDSALLVDVTDVVEFLARQESPSGVQRVVLGTMPILARHGARAMALDRSRGVFVLLEAREQQQLLDEDAGSDNELVRSERAGAASELIARIRTAPPVQMDDSTVALFLGAVWINDALMIAARDLHARGAHCVYLLYDLTPVLEAGHTETVQRLFAEYLTLVSETGSRVPAISRASRADFERWCREHRKRTPEGTALSLPNGLDPQRFEQCPEPWPRPFALMVGTIENRKNHLLALRAWQKLIARHGSDQIPDLVCVGRLGWRSEEFLEAYRNTKGAGGKVSVLTGGVSDDDLGAFYRHAQFTVYPSRYEGWGLPVSESLAFGKVTITADNSSLREAGGESAIYVTTDDVDALVAAVEDFGINQEGRAQQEQALRGARPVPVTWHDVAEALLSEARMAGDEQEIPVTFPDVELSREYVFRSPVSPPSGDYADKYARFLAFSDCSPLLAQPSPPLADAGVLLGQLGAPQPWGLECHPGRRIEFRVTRPVGGDLIALFATRSQPGVVEVETTGPGGPTSTQVHLGSVLTVPLGLGSAGEPALASIRVSDATDSVEGFMGMESFVVLEASDLQARITALEAANRALRQELDFIHGTRSWKLTAPLRKWKGRGA